MVFQVLVVNYQEKIIIEEVIKNRILRGGIKNYDINAKFYHM